MNALFEIEQLVDGVWITASQHTQEIDRDTQYQIFLSRGVPAEDLRFK